MCHKCMDRLRRGREEELDLGSQRKTLKTGPKITSLEKVVVKEALCHSDDKPEDKQLTFAKRDVHPSLCSSFILV